MTEIIKTTPQVQAVAFDVNFTQNCCENISGKILFLTLGVQIVKTPFIVLIFEEKFCPF